MHPSSLSAFIWIVFVSLMPIFSILVPRASAPAIFIILVFNAGRILDAWPNTAEAAKTWFALLVGLILWEMIGLIWAEQGLRLLHPILMTAIIYGAAFLMCLSPPMLARNAHNGLVRTLTVGWIILLFLVAVDLATHGWIYNNLVAPLTGNDGQWLPRWLSRAMTYATLMFWPIAAAYGGRRTALIACFCVLLMAVAIRVGHAATFLAMLTGCLGAMLVRIVGSNVIMGVGYAVAAVFLLMPLMPYGPLDPAHYQSWLPEIFPSAWHRLLIWQHASSIIAEHPLRGLGIDAFRFLPSAKADLRGWQDNELIVLHPHNGMLQVWLELGLPGVLIFIGALLAIFRKISLMEVNIAGAGLGLTLSAITYSCLSFGMWQSWWQALIGLSASLFMAISLPRLEKERQ